jgi:hypothetical protein
VAIEGLLLLLLLMVLLLVVLLLWRWRLGPLLAPLLHGGRAGRLAGA